MKISVVVTTYNSEEHIKECLSSIFSASRTPEEVVVTDQCSTDQTRVIVESFEQVDLLTTDNESLSPVSVFNKGLRTASGDLVVMLDDDTEVVDGFFKSIEDKFESSDNSLGVLQASLQENGRTLFTEEEEKVKIRGCAFATRKEVFDEIGYLDSRFEIFRDDYEFGNRVVANGYRIESCPDALAVHKTDVDGSQSWRELKNNTRNQIWIAWKYYRGRNAAVSTFYRPARSLMLGLQSGNVSAAVKGFFEAWTKIPEYAFDRNVTPKVENRDWTVSEVSKSLMTGLKRAKGVVP